MDQPGIDDDDHEFGGDPLDVVEHVLTAEKLSFDRTEDGDLAFSLAGNWREYELWFAWRPDVDCLQLCLSIDRQTGLEKRASAYELLSLINQRMWHGHFEIWADEGEIIYRHALALAGDGYPSLSQAASMIDSAVEAADRFYPAFDFMLAGQSPEEAMAACMFETAGEA